jgi:3-hydroxyacyl-CoA dehydrogenase/3-hydroxy-2-methylbutyryl-CoA dehydrogenase
MGYTVALVTGGASGLGESATRSLSKYGYKVAILDLNVERAEAIVNELGASNTFFVKTDVSNETQVKEAIQKVVATFGAIHLVLNSAGILAAAKIFTNRGVASTDVLQKVLTVNVAGTFNVTKYAA